LFWRKALNSDNTVIQELVTTNKRNFGLVMSKYHIASIHTGANVIKQHIWMQFVENSSEHGKRVFC